MSNMSYCRFQNTLADYKVCVRSVNETLSEPEHFARENLIRESVDLLGELGVELDEGQLATLNHHLGELEHE